MKRVLIANRGEIVRRIVRTARELGLETVAVYAEPDAGSPFVRDADCAVPLLGSTPETTYLDAAQLIAAAERVGADSIHPGYGFLSENADFAEAVTRAGLQFVGPPARVIAAMGDKIEAKRLAREAGVPTLPSSDNGEVVDGLEPPILVKAAAGGGGRGMRVVETLDALPEAIAAAQREAQSAFGDGRIFLERLLRSPRHVEIQIVADDHGTVLHLGERDCSVQRRHQKIIEESPSPGVDAALRARMAEASVALATSIGYRGVGTIEFLVSGDEFFFLEMNTRLQVEHPVTEAVTGLDLVRLQFEIAAGGPLRLSQPDVAFKGHAVEVRLYAEDPARGFLPSPGTVVGFQRPDVAGVRWDDALESGAPVPSAFDPMLAKVIAHADSRPLALRRLVSTLRGLQLHGVNTNVELLKAVLEDPDFAQGIASTDFLEQRPQLLEAQPSQETTVVHAIAAALVAQHRRRLAASVQRHLPSGWRNVPSAPQQVTFAFGERPLAVTYRFGRNSSLASLEVNGAPHAVTIEDVRPDGIELVVDGVRRELSVAGAGEAWWVNGSDGQTELLEEPRFHEAAIEAAAGGLQSPIPGLVAAVHVTSGDRVAAGQPLVVVEAMKMEHLISAPVAGVVAEVLVTVGSTVAAHQKLVEFDADESGAEAGPAA